MLYWPNLKSYCAYVLAVVVGMFVFGLPNGYAQDDLPTQILDLNLRSQLKFAADHAKLLSDRYDALVKARNSFQKDKAAEIEEVNKSKIPEHAKAAAIKGIEEAYRTKYQQHQQELRDLFWLLNGGAAVPHPTPVMPASVPCPPAMQAPRHPLFRRLGSDRGTGLNQRNVDVFRQAMEGYRQLKSQNLINFVASSPARLKSATEPSFDVRKHFGSNVVYPVQDQGQCGSCWSFAAVAAFEASHAYQFRSDASVSEQSVLSCANVLAPAAGTQASCEGAFADAGLAVLTRRGALDRRALPYAASDRPDLCNLASSFTYKAHEFGPVNVDSNAPPSVEMIKSHVKEYGAVVVGLKAGSEFRSAQQGVSEDFVVTEDTGEQADHAVIIIGWDDTKANGRGAWLVRNSWGPGFGNTGGVGSSRGYIWVQYNRSAIGGEAFWIKAQQTGAGPGPVTPSGNPDIQRAIEYWTKMGRS